MLTPEQICGIVVSYHPDDDALDCLKNTFARLAHTVVVDNASAPATREKLRALAGDRATIVENSLNEGVGAALNTGIRAAARLGFRWFLLLDQDTTLFPTTIEALVRVQGDCRRELNNRVALVGSNYFQRCADGSIREARVPYTEGRLWHEDTHAITAGTLLSRATFEWLGPFREDFFIDHVDHEYCFRARRLGLAIVQTAHPIMAHRIGLAKKRRVWFKLWAPVTLSGYSPLRRYYQLRNLLVLAAAYERDFPADIAMLRRHQHKEIKRALFYEGNFRASLRCILRALLDARRGRMGAHHAVHSSSAHSPVPISRSLADRPAAP